MSVWRTHSASSLATTLRGLAISRTAHRSASTNQGLPSIRMTGRRYREFRPGSAAGSSQRTRADPSSKLQPSPSAHSPRPIALVRLRKVLLAQSISSASRPLQADSSDASSSAILHFKAPKHAGTVHRTAVVGNPPSSCGIRLRPMSSVGSTGGGGGAPVAHRPVTAAVMSLPVKAAVKKLSR
jgi:hypothetical protein